MNCHKLPEEFSKLENNLYCLFDTSTCYFGNKNCLVSVKHTETLTLTYDEVHHQVQQLSNSFVFPSHNFVGVLGYELTAEIIVCILCILKSGAAFVFLNVAESGTSPFPLEELRILYIIGKKETVQEWVTQQLDNPFNFLQTVDILGEEFGIWNRSYDGILAEDGLGFDFAFAVLSSGSTKQIPKVIKVPHCSILPNIFDLTEIYQLEPADRVYVSTPPTFDPCIHDIFLAFNAGCSILMTNFVSKYQLHHIGKLFSIEGYNATVFFTTPSMLRKWMLPTGLSSLKILTLGGEPFPSVEPLRDVLLSGVRVYNIYGITEVSCWASIALVTCNCNEPIPLGSQLSDTIFQLRADNGCIIDEGVGELFIGSANRICVVDNDFQGARIGPCFRASGDLVKVSNGKYYYVGRKDRRIKLFGHQIDLTLIENRLLIHASVKYCLIFVEGVEIIALVEINEKADANVTAEDLKEFASQDLPSHMLPNDICIVPELLVNSHGKISLKKCKELYDRLKNPKKIYSEFRSLWRKYTTSSFFDLKGGFIDSGGNSFAALQLNASLESITDVPQHFIEFLITNKSFSECLELIDANNKRADSSSSVSINRKRINKTDINPSNVKMTRFDHLLTSILLKGHTLLFGRIFSSISKIDIEWKYELEKCVDASPTLLVFKDRAVAVCGSHSGYLVVIEVSTGAVISKLKLPDRIESSACASLNGHHIFIGCYDGNMYAIDIQLASVIWKFATDDIVKSTAILFNNNLYFGSYDHNFYCISSLDGTLCWKVNIDESAIYATAIVRNDIIISATLAGTVAFIDHDGIVKKKVCDMKPIFSNPIEIPGQNIFVVADVSGCIRCFDLQSCSELWRNRVCDCIFSSLSLMGGEPMKMFFVSQNGYIFCLEVSRLAKRKLWECTIGKQAYATPFCCETWKSTIAVSTDGDIYILDADSGHVLTSYSIKAPVFSSPVAFENHIVVGSRDNYLYCLKVCE